MTVTADDREQGARAAVHCRPFPRGDLHLRQQPVFVVPGGGKTPPTTVFGVARSGTECRSI
jgi:hypothetical protein